jgi:DNA-binding MarR family transcriptional regulator
VIFPPLSAPDEHSTLFRLIEAGQLAHKALLEPLRERGLEPGDDGLLFALREGGLTEAELSERSGIDDAALLQHIDRLIERELMVRQAVGPKLVPGLALTERGERMAAMLAANWAELESALWGELIKKDQRLVERTLRRFVDLLRL